MRPPTRPNVFRRSDSRAPAPPPLTICRTSSIRHYHLTFVSPDDSVWRQRRPPCAVLLHLRWESRNWRQYLNADTGGSKHGLSADNFGRLALEDPRLAFLQQLASPEEIAAGHFGHGLYVRLVVEVAARHAHFIVRVRRALWRDVRRYDLPAAVLAVQALDAALLPGLQLTPTFCASLSGHVHPGSIRVS